MTTRALGEMSPLLGLQYPLRATRGLTGRLGGCPFVSPEVHPVDKGRGWANPQAGSVLGHLV